MKGFYRQCSREQIVRDKNNVGVSTADRIH